MIEELQEWKSSGSGLENKLFNGRGDSLRWSRDTLYSLKLAPTSLTSGGRSVGIFRLQTQATEFSLIYKDINTKTCIPWTEIPSRETSGRLAGHLRAPWFFCVQILT
jgi:hypothetical protein